MNNSIFRYNVLRKNKLIPNESNIIDYIFMLCMVMYIRLDSAHLSFLKIIFLGIVFPKGMKDAVCV